MGSPLGPVLANLFMSFHEANWIKVYGSGNILFYKRYVDDIFCLLNNENEAEHFLEYLNSKHTSIKFTMKTEAENKIPFLDILITSPEKGDFHTSVCRKNTFTGLLLNFNSFTPLKYKLGLIQTLSNRVFKISFNWLTFHAEILNVKNLLSKNACQ